AAPAAGRGRSPAPPPTTSPAGPPLLTTVKWCTPRLARLCKLTANDSETAAMPDPLLPGIPPVVHANPTLDYMSMVFVFMLATFIGIGVIRRVSRLLHTPLMSLTNAISAIAVVGAIIVAGGENYTTSTRVLGAIALFASMTNIISGFLITDRMLRMF